jgi:hypothetical protein
MIRPFVLAIVACLTQWNIDPAQAVNIGTFDTTRGGIGSLLSSEQNGVRTAITANFPGTTISGTSELTSSFFSTIDLVWVMSARAGSDAISPLSATEQSALRTFVEGGGRALLFSDNELYDGAASDPANESLIDPFGLDIMGNVAGVQVVSATLPNTSPVTNGPFGTVTSYSTNFPGWFNNLGPDASTLATLNANSQPALAFIPPRTLSATSGGVVLFSDGNTAIDPAGAGVFGSAEQVLILNAIAATVPEPSALLLIGTYLAAFLVVRRRRQQ